MPTAFMSMLPRPCATGLLRPKRLFEVDGTTGGAPSSHCGLEARGGHGLPPATAPSIMPESAGRELQAGTMRSMVEGAPRARRLVFRATAPSTAGESVDGALGPCPPHLRRRSPPPPLRGGGAAFLVCRSSTFVGGSTKATRPRR